MAKQISFKKVDGWGGKRKNAGRPNLTGRVSNGKRPKVDFKKPLHITMSLRKGAPLLRTKATFKEFTNCVKLAKKFGLHVLHFSLLNDHVHMVAEAKNNKGLAGGMKSICGRLGKRFGGIFDGRFHLQVITNPTQMKNTYAYVLFNLANHRKLLHYLDSFSTAKFFHGLAKLARGNPLLTDQIRGAPKAELPDYLSPPQSWLAAVGWERAA